MKKVYVGIAYIKIASFLVGVASLILLSASWGVLAAGNTSITVIQGAEPRSLDPTMCTGKSCIVVQNSIFDTLVYHTANAETIPWLATSWESVSPLVWRIDLRKGVRFQNGEPFDASAVAFTIRTYQASTGEGGQYFSFIDHVEIVDDYTINVITKTPNVATPASLALLYILPPDYYAEVGPNGFNQHPIGTGPYVFEEWQQGVYIRLTANQDYWNGVPQIGEAIFRNAPEATTRLAMLLTGKADIITDVPPEMVEQINGSARALVKWTASQRKIFVEFNKDVPPFDDVRVRKAANYAVDKDALIESVLGGFGAKRKGVILPGWIGYNPKDLVSYDYNPEKAVQLLTEAGYPNGVSVDFWYPIGRYLKDSEVSEAIANMLAGVGIKCRMHGMDISSLCQKVHTQTLQGMHFFSNAPDWYDTDSLWRCQFWTQGLNRYACDATTDKYIQDGVSTAVVSERAENYRKLETYVVNELVPWIFLYDQALIYGVSNRLNWEPRPDEIIDLRDASVSGE